MKKVGILGAGGAVAHFLTQELQKENIDLLRLGRRSNFNSENSKTVENVQLDLLKKDDVNKITTDLDTVFLVAGLQYNINVWQKEWPIVIDNVIEACIQNNCKLIFFDNVYSYGKVEGSMTENTEHLPCSKKGQIRKDLIEKIFYAIKTKKLKAIIAKSADFYGPKAEKSNLYIMNIQSLVKNKKPSFVGNPNKLHNYTFVPDAAKALVILSKDETAINQIWHLPTQKAISGDEIMKIINKAFDKPNQYSVVTKFMMRLAGIFNSEAKELVEMFYQFDSDYIFDSSKFCTKYNFSPTTYEEGIKITVDSFKTEK